MFFFYYLKCHVWLQSLQEQEERLRLRQEKERQKEEAKAAKEKKKEEARKLREEKEKEKREKKEKEEREKREKREKEEKEKAERLKAKEELRKSKMEWVQKLIGPFYPRWCWSETGCDIIPPLQGKAWGETQERGRETGEGRREKDERREGCRCFVEACI